MPWILFATLLVYHLLSWVEVYLATGHSWDELLSYLDAAHYTEIIRHGYSGAQWAFYPLYPVTVGLLHTWLGVESIAILGTFVSLLIFCLTICWLLRLRNQADDSVLKSLIPRTNFGWWLFLFAPGSYIFHSHHTESLFFALSIFAFAFALKSAFYRASIIAGLCALTRNQGIFVAITTAWILASQASNGSSFQSKRFLGSGLVSGVLFAIYPLYQWYQVGNPLQFVEAQKSWNFHVTHWSDLFAMWVLRAPAQHQSLRDFWHLIYFVLIAITLLIIRREECWKRVYIFLSLLPVFFQATFSNDFRFFAVLSVAAFALGDFLWDRSPRLVALFVGLLFLYLNHMTTRGYLLSKWAY